MEYLEVVYRIADSDSSSEERVESILLEQTIETPRSVAERYPFVRDNMMGSVRSTVRDHNGDLIATLALPAVTASVDPAQFLNVLFGNSSLHADVTLEDFSLPASVAEMLTGPRHGLAGLREVTGVNHRPLTCSALKPVGLTMDELAAVCRALADGGIDLIKDDHYLANHAFAPVSERVRTCQRIVEEVAERTGHRAVYVPNLSGTPDDVRRQAEIAQKAGVGAVMMAPLLLGLPTFHQMIRDELEVPAFAHPSFGGIHAIRPATLYGRLFRLYGADAVIFANFGGRFSYSRADCQQIAERLREPWMNYRPSFPVPAGGMSASRVPELVDFFGRDVTLLVGGSLLEAGDALRDRTREFTNAVKAAAQALTGA